MAAKGSRTEALLIEAAAREFNEHGFGGTDTNKIARRAGFAPQTFYRWFPDKVAVFLEVYEQWRRDQFAELGAQLARQAGDADLAGTVVSHHRRFLVFRRSLRALAVENETVRKARASSRLSQLEFIRGLAPGRDLAELAAMLLQMERLADALAEGELRDMGLDEGAARAALVRLIHDLRTPAGARGEDA